MAKKNVGTALAKLLSDVQTNSTSRAQDSLVSQKSNVKDKGSIFEKRNEAVTHNSALVIQKLDPNSCELWEFADRPDDELGNIEELANSIKSAGQLEPILVRPIKDKQYQVIFGNRRWRACKLLKRNVLAIVKEISDQDAALVQKFENSERENISNHAMAKSYKRLIDKNVFSSELELSKHLQMRPQTLNDLFAYLRVPESLVVKLLNFKSLPKKLVIKLASLSKKQKNLDVLIKLSDQIDNGKIHVKNIDLVVEKYLQSSSIPQAVKSKPVLVKDKNNKAVLKLNKHTNGSCTIKVNENIAGKISLEQLETTLKELYQI